MKYQNLIAAAALAGLIGSTYTLAQGAQIQNHQPITLPKIKIEPIRPPVNGGFPPKPPVLTMPTRPIPPCVGHPERDCSK